MTLIISRKIGNHSSGEKRSHDGRKGRGADAFTAKITDDWRIIEQRIEQIAMRSQVLRVRGSAARVSEPLHVHIATVKAIKF